MTKFVRFDSGQGAVYGVLEGEKVFPVSGSIFGKWEKSDWGYRVDEVKFLAPCEPTKVVCVGTNYHEVVEKKGEAAPEEPVIFLKPPTSVIGPEDAIVIPPGVKELNFEVELVVVIKERVRCVSPEEAKNYILGYTCGNDVTAKDFMEKGKPWTRAKGYDTFMPVGPCIATGIDGDNLAIRMYHNGKLVQDSNTSDMIFGVAKLVSFVSHIMTLNPGDLISTGTPPGKGILKPGDIVEAEIEGIGRLKNYVK
ncbi:MAG: fumarylacetoacetate hydrolase family protein [Thermosediminibacteraceae bacterium]|nr:fumarylacetoacetate hydrolase family protein [Thermosediminibacteraceae bacterium]